MIGNVLSPVKRFLGRSRPEETAEPAQRVDAMAGPYRLLQQIDGGGEALVWQALHAASGYPAVVKVQGPDAPPDRLHREVAIIHDLQMSSVPNVVRLLPLADDGVVQRFPGMMQNWLGEPRLFCPLEALPSGREHNLIKQGPLGQNDAIAVCDSLRAALRAMHVDFGILHNDLKPDNVVVWRDGQSNRPQVRLIDFGQAAQLLRHPQTGQPYIGPTPDYAYVYDSGTWPYVSPERWNGESIDDRSDQWSFAATVFELLTGSRLIEAHGQTQCREAILGGAHFASIKRAKLTEPVKAVFERALALSMVERFEGHPAAGTAGIEVFFHALEGALVA